MPELPRLSRRGFLRASAAAGGGLALVWAGAPERAGSQTGALGSWLRVAADGSVELGVDKAEMGQGIHTAFAMIVAEELVVPLERVRVTTRTLEGRPRRMSTGSSSSVREGAGPLRVAAAAARAMLLAEGAARLAAPEAECRVAGGRVSHPATGRALPYAELAEAAARRRLPDDPAPLADDAPRVVGGPALRVDAAAKVDGSAAFGVDVRLPGLLHAAVVMPDAVGSRLLGFDAGAARARPGVVDVVELREPAPPGVAVIAERWWQAERALPHAAARFSEPDPSFDSDAYDEALREGLDRAGALALRRGDVAALLESGAPVHSARYQVPFLAHATLEPQNCTAHVHEGGCEIWAPTQSPGRMRPRVAALLGIPEEGVRVHTTYLGGGFGRRYEPDLALQAVQASRAVGRPVQVLWTRTQDLRHDFYRPAFASELRAVLDDDGLPRAWWQRVAGPWYEARDAAPWARRLWARLEASAAGPRPSPLWDAVPDRLRYRVPPWMRSSPSGLALGGAGPQPYAVPAARVEFTLVEAPVALGYWRSVAHSQNAFFVESFVDELAEGAGVDPLRYRLRLLEDAPRARAVLERAAAAAAWGEPLPPGRARGVALHPSFGSYVATVAEVEATADGGWRVVRVVCAADCGRLVHPGGVAAQIEGGIVFGLSTLDAEVRFRDGAAVASNFHDFPIPSLADAPEIAVELVASDRAPGGVGEIATPPVAPAVANALFAATGRRARRLPLDAG